MFVFRFAWCVVKRTMGELRIVVERQNHVLFIDWDTRRSIWVRGKGLHLGSGSAMKL
jgi:hypothetical protein